ncbi:MAG: hypothetical protein ABL989_02760 [Gammaproteobacteria bacterium]
MTRVSNGRIAMTLLAMATGLATPASFGITIGGGGDAREVDLAATYDLAAAPATTAPTYIVARGTPKNVAKVAIVSFCVGIVDARSVGGSSGPYSASASSPFPGTLDPQRLGEVANGYREQLVADLRAAGIEVLEHEDLAARPTYQKLAAKMTTDGFETVDSYELGKGTWANNRVQVISPGARPALKDCRKLTPGTQMSFAKAMYEKDMDGITMLSANVTLDFAKAKAAGGFFRGAKADLEYGQYVAPGIDSTSFQFAGKSGGGTLWLKQAIVAAQNPFAEGGKGEKTTDVKMDNEYDPDSSSTRTTSQSTAVSADMDLWYSNAAGELKALSGMLAETLKASK